MTRLFAAIYLDEDVDALVAVLLSARGFDVQTTLEAGNVGHTDAEQLAYSAAQERAILTHNRVDFEGLAARYFESALHHAGILIASRRPPYDLAQRLLAILNSTTADELRDQLRYL